MFMSFFLALIGCLVTGIQSILIYLQGAGVCFNNGCEIVDTLTLIDPLYFNLAGFALFLVAAIGLASARKGSELWQRFISLLLLAALAAEGVLFSFQVIISEAFCSYCLIVLSLIALMNLFMGLKQFFKGAVIFSVVLLASFVLDYHGGSLKPQNLENGTYGRLISEQDDKELFLFVSSTCEHCKKVIASLGEDRTCTVNFNPIDPIDSLPLEDVEQTASYDPGINLAFLKRLDIKEIPVLLSRTDSSMMLIKGEQAILTYIDERCRPAAAPAISGTTLNMTSSYQPPLPAEDDGCTIEDDCSDVRTGTSDQSTITIQ
jgi:hypothetical protein